MADAAIAVVVLVFALTLMPMLVEGTVVPIWTGIPMAIGALVLTAAYISLGLWFSVIVEAASAVLWTIIARRSFT